MSESSFSKEKLWCMSWEQLTKIHFGHKWDKLEKGQRCRYCSRRYEHFLYFYQNNANRELIICEGNHER